MPRPLPEARGEASPIHLKQENDQLRHAVASHATVDQAIGVLIAVHRIAPAAGFEVLREVSQQTNIKLHSVAQIDRLGAGGTTAGTCGQGAGCGRASALAPRSRHRPGRIALKRTWPARC
ncbi:ANTAR domain-containing protein [Streptomyces massasporeus]